VETPRQTPGKQNTKSKAETVIPTLAIVSFTCCNIDCFSFPIFLEIITQRTVVVNFFAVNSAGNFHKKHGKLLLPVWFFIGSASAV
jgi:hypothetical protein